METANVYTLTMYNILKQQRVVKIVYSLQHFLLMSSQI